MVLCIIYKHVSSIAEEARPTAENDGKGDGDGKGYGDGDCDSYRRDRTGRGFQYFVYDTHHHNSNKTPHVTQHKVPVVE